MIEGRDRALLRFYLKYLEPFTKFMETPQEFMAFFCQAALLTMKSLLGNAVNPSSPLGLAEEVEES